MLASTINFISSTELDIINVAVRATKDAIPIPTRRILRFLPLRASSGSSDGILNRFVKRFFIIYLANKMADMIAERITKVGLYKHLPIHKGGYSKF